MTFLSHLIAQHQPSQQIDACHLTCPLPLLKLKQGLHQIQTGNMVYIITTDTNSPNDIKRYCERGKAQFVHVETTMQDHVEITHLLVRKTS